MPLLLNKWLWAAAASLILIIGAYVWLKFHDHAIAAAADARCAARVSLAMEEAQIKANAAQAAYAKQLEDAQHVYEEKLSTPDPIVLNLGQRLHHYEIRSCPVPQSAPATSGTVTASGVASGNEEIGRATQEVFDACRRDSLRLNTAQQLWPKL